MTPKKHEVFLSFMGNPLGITGSSGRIGRIAALSDQSASNQGTSTNSGLAARVIRSVTACLGSLPSKSIR